MKIFFDTEFTGLHKDTTLISLGCVAEDGKTFYAEFTDYDGTQCNNWIRENVIQHLIVSKDGIDRWVHYASEQLKSTEACVRTNGYCTIMRGNRDLIAVELRDWLKQFDSVQFISDVCHYDFVLLIDLFGTAFDLPENVSASCHDINQDISRHYSISEREAFDKSREEIAAELCSGEISGVKHNALYDARVIKAIYEEICGGKEE